MSNGFQISVYAQIAIIGLEVSVRIAVRIVRCCRCCCCLSRVVDDVEDVGEHEKIVRCGGWSIYIS